MSAYLSEGNELLSWKDICILMFVTALFTTAKIQKQPKNPLTDEWIKRMWYIHTHTHTHTHTEILHRHKKGNSAFCDNMDGPETIILSKISQTEKDKYWMISFLCGI